MSKPTASTEWTRKARRELPKDHPFGYLVAALAPRPDSERVAGLVRSGILTHTKKLSAKYKVPKLKPKLANKIKMSPPAAK